MQPLLSVIVPHYNMAKYLPEALGSIFCQTFTDFEIVLIDDCSTDQHSLALVEELRQHHPRIRLLHNERNLGAVLTVNRGLQEAQGKYVFLLAADDKVLEKTFFEQMISILEKHPQFSMCTSDHAMFIDGIDKLHTWRVFPHLDALTPISAQQFLAMCQKGEIKYWLFAMGSIFRKELFVENDFFSTDFPVLADWYLIHLFALKGGCLYLPGIFVAWRHRENNNLYQHMKSNEVLNLLRRIAKTAQHRRLFARSTLLGCYLKQKLIQVLMRPHLWTFLVPFLKRKIKNICQAPFQKNKTIKLLP